ncbi:ribosome biogenesis protein WDR12 homolog [Venturia canescens]|uniref:ribosome biogenesis protein WDR12 homolog n=1 Tax=Venturia canescens TaxID=32260 RepID=UPI001C9D38B9|nr:ribosome biogenesis protein WDR12 homolog [Venturia canescens]XP_043282911.1 ribosome biogenesis protein WDR12 homolog [Venturia canescens]XP_043282912.1 ribosome biogenesis protein WDR12 homolog [Venturia canescens]XP_043282913.1 ribosome biogenesis protein WDR12 homolog [Venturia canescens]XP_043282914.1 ribosome biogenesis protein WDR12 homolog [Venturia canescens]
MAGKSADSDASQIQIRFTTKQQHYAVPDFPLSVPAAIISTELNSLVNELLKESKGISQGTQFDFLVCREFLRTSLLEHINERELSTEEVVDVEYFEIYPPPEPQDCLIHDDWVSAVAVCEKWILTGCYDNTLHLWTARGKHHLTIPGHASPVKAVAWISMDLEIGRFVSASQDQTAIIWNWNIANNSVDHVHICRGHSQSLEAVSVSYDGSTMATGSWDTMIKIWSTLTYDENDDGESASKRSKSEYGKTRTPKRTMKGHKEAISGVAWSDTAEIITSSWDHTLKIWDSELGGMKHEIAGNKSFFDLDYSRLSRTIVTGSADRHIRLYDPRSTEGSVVKATFTSHTQWVQTVRWSTTNEYLFMSGAYDNGVKLWDTRSPKAPLYDLTGHEDKVLCSNWSNPKLMVSGGADNTVRIFKTKHALP